MKDARFQPDADLKKDIRANFSARYVVQLLLTTAAAMAEAIGVQVEWSITSVDETKKVNPAEVAGLISRLATIGGAFCLGGRLNPIKMLQERKERVTKAQKASSNREET